MQNRNLKQQQSQQQENQKAQFLNFIQGQDKTSADYINMLTSDSQTRVSGTHKLEAMVRAQLRKEFPGIENKKSYEFLVSAVIHNYQKKQLQAMDGEID
ncbi:MAG: hypothetical protein ACI4SM_02910 [Candidatus Gastranaerophilaceae bacterium]